MGNWQAVHIPLICHVVLLVAYADVKRTEIIPDQRKHLPHPHPYPRGIPHPYTGHTYARGKATWLCGEQGQKI
jgi:hypothetical protein